MRALAPKVALRARVPTAATSSKFSSISLKKFEKTAQLVLKSRYMPMCVNATLRAVSQADGRCSWCHFQHVANHDRYPLEAPAENLELFAPIDPEEAPKNEDDTCRLSP